MAAILPEFLVTYLEQRDAARADDVTAVLASLTDRERVLVKDAAVMGYVRGTMAPKGEPIPKGRAILAEVIDACLAFPDLYPAICADPDPGAAETQPSVPAEACQFHAPDGDPCAADGCGHAAGADCHPNPNGVTR
jgi:hypothetical protein